MKAHLALLVAVALVLNGCVSFVYRVVEPPGVPSLIADQHVVLHYPPLEYQLSKSDNRLLMTINNPTEDRITLLGNASVVVDPNGLSHPIRTQVIGPHSYTGFYLPPPARYVAYPDYWWGYGWGGWYGPYGPYGPYWGPYYGPPPVSYARITTPFDWTWKTGPARLTLTYQSKTNVFEHRFEIVREEK